MNGDQEVTRYAVKVISSAVYCQSGIDGGRVMTEDGEEFWVCEGEYGPEGSMRKPMPPDVMTFATRDEARSFASSWTGSPWWVKPKDWRIIAVVPRYVRSGWREA